MLFVRLAFGRSGHEGIKSLPEGFGYGSQGHEHISASTFSGIFLISIEIDTPIARRNCGARVSARGLPESRCNPCMVRLGGGFQLKHPLRPNETRRPARRG